MPELDGKKYSYDKEGKKDFMKAMREKKQQNARDEQKRQRSAAMNRKKNVKSKTDEQRRYKKSPNKRSSENYLKKRAPKANAIGGTQSGMRKYKKRTG